jgi:hypothetical protein
LWFLVAHGFVFLSWRAAPVSSTLERFFSSHAAAVSTARISTANAPQTIAIAVLYGFALAAHTIELRSAAQNAMHELVFISSPFAGSALTRRSSATLRPPELDR